MTATERTNEKDTIMGQAGMTLLRKPRRKSRSTAVVHYDDLVLLINLIRSYCGSDVPLTAEVRVAGSRQYVWTDRDPFQSACCRIS